MSTTLYVDGWSDQPSRQVVVYMDERYPELDREYFAADPFCKKDDSGRYFEIETVYDNPYPELTLSYASWPEVVRLLGFSGEDEVCCKVSFEELPAIIRRCIAIINSDQKCDQASRPMEVRGNFMDGGLSSEKVKRSVQEFLDIACFAQQQKRAIYWA